MDDAAGTAAHPELPWVIGALILLGAIGIGRAVQDEAWVVAGITGAGVLGFVVLFVLVVRRRPPSDA